LHFDRLAGWLAASSAQYKATAAVAAGTVSAVKGQSNAGPVRQAQHTALAERWRCHWPLRGIVDPSNPL